MKQAQVMILLVLGIALAHGQLRTTTPPKSSSTILEKCKPLLKIMNSKLTQLTFSEVQTFLTPSTTCTHCNEECFNQALKAIQAVKIASKTTGTAIMAGGQCTNENMAKIFCLVKDKPFLAVTFVKMLCGKTAKYCATMKANLFVDSPVCEAKDFQLKPLAISFTKECVGSNLVAPNAHILAFLYTTPVELIRYIKSLDKATVTILIKDLTKNPKIFAAFPNCVKQDILKAAADKGSIGDIVTSFKTDFLTIKTAGSKSATVAQKAKVEAVLGIVPYLAGSLCDQFETNDKLLGNISALYKDAKWKAEMAGKEVFFDCSDSDSVRNAISSNDSKTLQFMKRQQPGSGCSMVCGKKLFSKVAAGSSDDLSTFEKNTGKLAACADNSFVADKLKTIQPTQCQALSELMKKIIMANKTLDDKRIEKCKPTNKNPSQYTKSELEGMGCSSVCDIDTSKLRTNYTGNAAFCTFWALKRKQCESEPCRNKKSKEEADRLCDKDIPANQRPKSASTEEIAALNTSEIKTALENLEISTAADEKKGRILFSIMKRKSGGNTQLKQMADTPQKVATTQGKKALEEISAKEIKTVFEQMNGFTADDIKQVAQNLKGGTKMVKKAFAEKLKNLVSQGTIQPSELKEIDPSMKEDINCDQISQGSVFANAFECNKAKLQSNDEKLPADISGRTSKKLNKAAISAVQTLKDLSSEYNKTDELTNMIASTPKELTQFAASNGTLRNHVSAEASDETIKKSLTDEKRRCALNDERSKNISDYVKSAKGVTKQTQLDSKFADYGRIVYEWLKQKNVTSSQLGNDLLTEENLRKAASSPTAVDKDVRDEIVKKLKDTVIDWTSSSGADLVPPSWVALVCNGTTQLTTAQINKCKEFAAQKVTEVKDDMSAGEDEFQCSKKGKTQQEKDKRDQDKKDCNKAASEFVKSAQSSGQSAGRRRRAVTSYTCATVQAFPKSEVVTEMTVEYINAMTSTEYGSCIEYLGGISGWSAAQYTALFEKAMVFNGINSPYSTMTSAQSGVIGSMAHGLTDSQINGLTNIVSMMLDLGVLSEWSTSQLSALASKYMTTSNIAQPSGLTSSNLIEMGHALCGLTSAQITTIPAAEYLTAAATVNNMTTGDTSCLSALATLAKDNAAYGPVSSWDVYIYSSAGILIGGLSADELNQASDDSVGEWGKYIALIPASVFQHLSVRVLENIPTIDTVYVTQAQRDTLSVDQKNALARAEAGFDGTGAVVYVTTGGCEFTAASMVTTVISMVIFYLM